MQPPIMYFFIQFDFGMSIGYTTNMFTFYYCSHKYQLMKPSQPSDLIFLTLTLMVWALQFQ